MTASPTTTPYATYNPTSNLIDQLSNLTGTPAATLMPTLASDIPTPPSVNTTLIPSTLTPSAVSTTLTPSVVSTTWMPTSAITNAPAPLATVTTVDPNAYLRLALLSLSNRQYNSTMNYTNLAINVQTQLGNNAAIAMLQASNRYTQGIVNPLLNNFGIPNGSLAQSVQYWLVGTLLVLLMMTNGQTAQGVSQPNIQQALASLNAQPTDVNGAIAAIQSALATTQSASIISYLNSALNTLNNFTNTQLQKLPLTPLQLTLAEFPQILMLLDGKSSPQDYNTWWTGNGSSGSDTLNQRYIGKGGMVGSSIGGRSSTPSHVNTNITATLPDPIQNFMISRTILNGAMNDMNTYLNQIGGYDALITKMQQAQTDLNSM